MPVGKEGMGCECTPIAHTQFGAESGRTPSEAIIDALAEAEGVDPMELDPLYETIDGDALDRLFTPRSESEETPSRTFGFTINSWNVFIQSEGSVVICDPDRLTDPAPVFSKISAD